MTAVRARLPPVVPAAVLTSALLCAVALLTGVRPVDLAAHVYRSELFRREGFALWDGGWYGGHHSLAYSVIFPPLGGLMGPFVVGAVAALVASACFAAIARRQWGDRAALWGAVWFGAGTGTLLLTGRIPFGLGLMFAAAAALAQQRGRAGLAAVLAIGSALASPVAAFFLGMGALALLLTGRWRSALTLGVASTVPVLALAIAFPEGGREPFAFSASGPLLLLLAALVVVLPREETVLRTVAAVNAVAVVVLYLVPTPLGGAATRGAALFAGPLLACALFVHPAAGRRARWAAAVVLAGCAFIQWSPAIRDTIKALDDPATQAAYYVPLVHELERHAAAGQEIGRVEIPFTNSHWEAAEVARRFPLARGWERQLDTARNPIFYGGVLNSRTYGAWLTDHAIGYVAVAASRPDYSAVKEQGLIKTGLPYLRPVWSSRDWRLYEVTLPHAMVVPERGAAMRLATTGNDELTLDVARPGSAVVKVDWSPYWEASGGCVERAGEWTRVTARRRGRLKVAISFSLGRVVSRGRRCA